jgi:hypothetical protein
MFVVYQKSGDRRSGMLLFSQECPFFSNFLFYLINIGWFAIFETILWAYTYVPRGVGRRTHDPMLVLMENGCTNLAQLGIGEHYFDPRNGWRLGDGTSHPPRSTKISKQMHARSFGDSSTRYSSVAGRLGEGGIPTLNSQKQGPRLPKKADYILYNTCESTIPQRMWMWIYLALVAHPSLPLRFSLLISF